MPQHLHAVFCADAHQELAIAAEVFCAKGAAPVEVADIAEHLAPLAGQQVDDIDALSRAFQPGCLWAEEMHMRIGRNPAALAPI